MGDFQSRALDVRYRSHRVDRDNKSTVHLTHVHMLNSTLTATGRGICCLLETHQTHDGVNVPNALVPYMGGMTFIPFVRGPREVDGNVAPPKVSAAVKTAPAKITPAPKAAPINEGLAQSPLANGAVKLEVLE